VVKKSSHLVSTHHSHLTAVVVCFSVALCSCGGGEASSSGASPTPLATPPTVSQTTTSLPDTSTWMQPNHGRAAFLGDDGGGSSTATVCDTAEHYRAWLGSESSTSCNNHARGASVIIDETTTDPSKDTAGGITMALVRIHAADGSWSGYTELMAIHPVIPKGTVIQFKRVGNETLRLGAIQQSNDGANLGDNVTVRLVKYDASTADADLYVTVLSGQYAGRSGWMLSMDGVTANGNPVAMFLQSATEATAEPSVDPNNKTYVTHKLIRAFKDISECDDATNAMSNDDAYQRLKDAVAAGDYYDFPEGTRLHVADDPQPDSLFLIAADDQGNQGCVGRYELPGYGQ
jgi:hypothetical protein